MGDERCGEVRRYSWGRERMKVGWVMRGVVK